MDLELTEPQRSIRDLAQDFARSKVAPGATARDRSGEYPEGLIREIARLGFFGINVPPELGGAGAGAVATALVLTELAAACASTCVTVAVTNMCAELVVGFGSQRQLQLLPKLLSGALGPAAFVVSEPHCGSDAAAIQTTAVRSGDRWVLSGTKQWISSGAHAGVFIVLARTHGGGAQGLSAFLVEGRPEGLTVGRAEDKMGLKSSHTVPLAFDGCEIAGDCLFGREGEGFKIAMAALNSGRIGVAAQGLGVARAALEASIAYAKDRQAFGQPIAQFQAIRWFLADIATELAAARLLTLRAAGLKEAGKPFIREASMAKLFSTELANRACDKALQIHGGYGYLDEFPVERYFRDARVLTIYEGTSQIQRLIIARETLKAIGDSQT